MPVPPDPRNRVAGVDGCPSGWLVATEHGAIVSTQLDRSLAATIGIDMPIGLPEDAPRVSDRQARAFLGARRSSVFPTPPRACLASRDYVDALERSRASIGVGISKQAYNLLPKIRELDDLVAPGEDRFVEIHPECAFLLMNDLEPLESKKTAGGSARRGELLRRAFGRLPDVPRGARRDDVLDAFAVLWSADRFVAGLHRTFGDGRLDGRGLPMRIVC